MIFYNSQLMQNQHQLRLYLVSNPVAFKRFEDHEAALQIQIHELVEKAIETKDDPVVLIQEYLQTSYIGEDTVEGFANFIICSGQMTHAMFNLRDNWDEMDESLPEVSLRYSNTSRKQATQVFYEITLRSYLEALSMVYDN